MGKLVVDPGKCYNYEFDGKGKVRLNHTFSCRACMKYCPRLFLYLKKYAFEFANNPEWIENAKKARDVCVPEAIRLED